MKAIEERVIELFQKQGYPEDSAFADLVQEALHDLVAHQTQACVNALRACPREHDEDLIDVNKACRAVLGAEIK